MLNIFASYDDSKQDANVKRRVKMITRWSERKKKKDEKARTLKYKNLSSS